MSKELLRQLGSCNLKAAAFGFVKTFSKGVYRVEVATALRNFSMLPCAETAVALARELPDVLPVLVGDNEPLTTLTPGESRGAYYDGWDEWMHRFDTNLHLVSVVHSFLQREASLGRVQVGFHQLRDQSVLFRRLALIGLTKGFFANGRQFLRDTITTKLSAFRAVADLVCIHGVYEGRERFWDGLGAESDAQYYTRSEVMFQGDEVAGKLTLLLSLLEQGVSL